MHANFAIVAPSDGPDVTAAAVARRLAVERRPVALGRTGERLQILEEQRRQFSGLSLRIKALGGDTRLKLPELAPLHRRAAEALQLSQLLFRELDEGPAGDGKEVPAETMAELLARNAMQLEDIELQLWLMESLDSAATGLQECVHELQQHATCPAGRFQQLARRIILDVDRSSDERFLQLDAEVSLKNFLGRRRDLKQPPVCATGIEAARLVAWMSRTAGMISERRELVTIAALLQDVGLLNLLRAKGASADDLIASKPDVYREHPAIGAALAAGIREYQVELPALVAQHHERLDGTGYPRRLVSYRLMTESRLLAVVSRYVELAGRSGLNIPSSENGTAAHLSPAHFAAVQLHREAEQGEFDMPQTMGLLNALGFELRATPKFEPGYLRLDAAHTSTSGPHFRELRSDTVPAPHFTRARAKRKHRADNPKQ